MELLKIEKYSSALKVFLKPTEAYPEGQNFFYCDTDFEDYIKNAKSFNFVSSKDGFRYPVVNGTSLHRTVMNTNNKQGVVVDHISCITWDDCRCNLRETTLRGNAINKRVLGVVYFQNKKALTKAITKLNLCLVHISIDDNFAYNYQKVLKDRLKSDCDDKSVILNRSYLNSLYLLFTCTTSYFDAVLSQISDDELITILRQLSSNEYNDTKKLFAMLTNDAFNFAGG